MKPEWPTVAVTFLFTDIEDSTPLWDRHRQAMRPALAQHDALLESAVTANGGVIVKTTGDGAMAAFASSSAALSAALDAQRMLQDELWPAIAPDRIRVRMGLHTGEAELRAGDYYGTVVNRAARLMSIAHGGQVLLSGTTTALVRSDLADGSTLLDLGEHHLKGLSRPAHVFQIQTTGLVQDFPPLRTGETQKGNLPQPLTSFVGRKRELTDIQQLMQEARLLTLTGPGGTGKTRLSLEVARHLEGSYDHGVWLTELAPLMDGELVPVAVATIFDLREQPNTPIMQTLADYLRSKKLLLILDNCEHLVAACARLAAELLSVAPALTILASSREGLGAPGETTFHIPALGIPTRDIVARDEIARFEAVRLFVARARTAKQGFDLTETNSEAVGQIVRRLDGIPLAIELAAARVKLMSPAQIADRLNDRFRLLTGGSRTALPRQQTLRALIDWSYDLLDEHERWFMRQMAVFVGGWTLEAAEYVVESAAEDAGYLDALDLLANLVNKSLVRIDDTMDEVRYYYLETIRQYARDRLFEAGEGSAARHIHFRYFQELADSGLGGGVEAIADKSYVARLENNMDNVRAALEWGTANYPEITAVFLNNLSAIWAVLALGPEAERRATSLLEALAELPAVEGETLRERQQSRALALNVLALGSAVNGGDEAGYEAARTAADLFRNEGSQPKSLAYARFWQAILGIETDHSEGEAAAQESYEIARGLNNQVLKHLGLVALARWQLANDNLSAAAAHLDEANRIRTQINVPLLIAYEGYTGALVARTAGDMDSALRVLDEGIAALRLNRSRHFANILMSERAHTLRHMGDLAGALAIYRQTIREWQDIGHRAAVANQLECFGFLAVSAGQFDRAARHFGAAEALRDLLSSKMLPMEKAELDAAVATLHQTMTADAMQEAWQYGRRLSMDAAVNLALSE